MKVGGNGRLSENNCNNIWSDKRTESTSHIKECQYKPLTGQTKRHLA